MIFSSFYFDLGLQCGWLPECAGVLGAMRRKLRSVHRNGMLVIISSRSHRGRNSFVISKRGVAPRVMGFVVARNEKLLYTPLPHSHYRRLYLIPVTRRGASLLNAPFAVSMSLEKCNYAAKISTFSHSSAVGTLITKGLGPSRFTHPKRIFPLCNTRGKILRHGKRARTALSVAEVTNLGPKKTLIRVLGRSNAVTHLPRLNRVTTGFNLGVISVGSVRRCHGGRGLWVWWV